MSTGEDDDLNWQRASALLLSDFEKLLPRLLRRRQQGSAPDRIRHNVRTVDMYKACSLVWTQ